MEKKEKEKDMTVNELAIIMRDSFQSNQEYIDKKFDAVDKKFEVVGKRFDQVVEKINNISRNIVDVVHKEEFDKLETRVVDLEKVADLPVKKS